MVWFMTWSPICIHPRCFDEHWRLFFYNDRTRVSAFAGRESGLETSIAGHMRWFLPKLSSHPIFGVSFWDIQLRTLIWLPCLIILISLNVQYSVDARLGKVNETMFFRFRHFGWIEFLWIRYHSKVESPHATSTSAGRGCLSTCGGADDLTWSFLKVRVEPCGMAWLLHQFYIDVWCLRWLGSCHGRLFKNCIIHYT